MKLFLASLFGLLLCGLLLGTVSAQTIPDPTSKRAKLIPDTDAPWGLAIEFAPGTTAKAAITLKQRYGLRFSCCGWQYATISATLQYSATATSADYDGDESSFYFGFYIATSKRDAVTGCWINNTCPPVYVISAPFEPVDSTTEAALLNEPIVARLDNRRNVIFFYLKHLECWLDNQMWADMGYTYPCNIVTPWE